MLEINKCHFGDSLELMKLIDNKSIDLIIADLPYGKTKNIWDKTLDLKLLWFHYERIIKDNGVVIIFGQDKFSAKVMLSNEQMHRYNIIWQKTTPTGHLNSKKNAT